MIERLIAFFQNKDLLLSDQAIDAYSEAHPLLQDEDIADVLWLANKIGGAYETDGEVTEEPEPEQDKQTIQVIDNPSIPAPPPPAVAVSIPETHQPDTASTEASEKGLPIQVQAAPALPDVRSMGRGLRPFMRKAPSLTQSMLDELATVNRIAEHDIWLPILKPASERWFDLELVIEASEFSFIWQETLAEFQHLLECQGAFRNVRAWSVEVSDAGQPRLVAKKQQTEQGQLNRSPKELVDASGRRLVLFISDCRSQLWQQGKIHKWLALWSRHGPAAIVQLLPERLWPQSELDVGFAVQVGALMPGIPNHKLQVRELPARTKIAPADSLTLPIVTLTANALKQWALVVSAAGRQRAPARLFDLAWVKDPERDKAATVIHPDSPEACVELFKATASPWAQQLASRMAAVPVDLPVVHLIQQELLPQVMPVHIAEVYSSGLLEKVTRESAEPGDPVQYTFVEGVRSLLNEATPRDQTLEVIEALSQRIARTLGFEIKSFTALLTPKSDWSQEVKEAVLPFAQVTTEVLYRLGGDYAELAKEVEASSKSIPDWLQSGDLGAESPADTPRFIVHIEINFLKYREDRLEAEEQSLEAEEQSLDDFPALEPFEFIDAQFAYDDATLSFPPPLQTETFTIFTLEPDLVTETSETLESFEFTVATLTPDETQWVIQPHQQRTHRFIETLPDNLSLEMVAIPGGAFLMGSPDDEPDRYDDESPQHEVTIQPFFMGRYPVTQAQWRAVANMPQVEQELQPDPSNFKGDNRLVEAVSWDDAEEFCARLSAHTGRQYRLPTEAEWEYACRAGTTTPFHFGEMILTEIANYDGDYTYNDGPKGQSRGETTPVDHFGIANAFGLSDMHGNVWEWCQDHWHENYEGAPTDGSAWLSSDERNLRVLRGGSWSYIPRDCRSKNRDRLEPDGGSDDIGCRVCCSAPRTL